MMPQWRVVLAAIEPGKFGTMGRPLAEIVYADRKTAETKFAEWLGRDDVKRGYCRVWWGNV
ncbi:hypothetical protein [Longispora albida]|uniref:hypothetical protein n=1 Tax=Longispora albida TaxID=203523 RepID=UPI00037922D4|nr:hypothetical protein [Longispora albida]